MGAALSIQSVEEPAATKPVAEILTSVMAEIAALAGDADRLQDVIGRLMPEGDQLDHDVIRQAQSIDIIVQRLQGLSQFLQTLSSDVPMGWRLDANTAADGLLLADLAHRLGGRERNAGPDISSGECDLF